MLLCPRTCLISEFNRLASTSHKYKRNQPICKFASIMACILTQSTMSLISVRTTTFDSLLSLPLLSSVRIWRRTRVTAVNSAFTLCLLHPTQSSSSGRRTTGPQAVCCKLLWEGAPRYRYALDRETPVVRVRDPKFCPYPHYY